MAPRPPPRRSQRIRDTPTPPAAAAASGGGGGGTRTVSGSKRTPGRPPRGSSTPSAKKQCTTKPSTDRKRSARGASPSLSQTLALVPQGPTMEDRLAAVDIQLFGRLPPGTYRVVSNGIVVEKGLNGGGVEMNRRNRPVNGSKIAVHAGLHHLLETPGWKAHFDRGNEDYQKEMEKMFTKQRDPDSTSTSRMFPEDVDALMQAIKDGCGSVLLPFNGTLVELKNASGQQLIHLDDELGVPSNGRGPFFPTTVDVQPLIVFVATHFATQSLQSEVTVERVQAFLSSTCFNPQQIEEDCPRFYSWVFEAISSADRLAATHGGGNQKVPNRQTPQQLHQEMHHHVASQTDRGMRHTTSEADRGMRHTEHVGNQLLQGHASISASVGAEVGKAIASHISNTLASSTAPPPTPPRSMHQARAVRAPSPGMMRAAVSKTGGFQTSEYQTVKAEARKLSQNGYIFDEAMMFKMCENGTPLSPEKLPQSYLHLLEQLASQAGGYNTEEYRFYRDQAVGELDWDSDEAAIAQRLEDYMRKNGFNIAAPGGKTEESSQLDTAVDGNGAEKHSLGEVFERFSQLSSAELKKLPPADYQICLELYKKLNNKKIKGQEKTQDDAKDTILRTMSRKVKEFNEKFEVAFLDGAFCEHCPYCELIFNSFLHSRPNHDWQKHVGSTSKPLHCLKKMLEKFANEDLPTLDETGKADCDLLHEALKSNDYVKKLDEFMVQLFTAKYEAAFSN